MKEQDLQKKIIAHLEACGYHAIKVITSSKRGTPDVIACSPLGVFTAIEAKAPGKLGGVTPLQAFNLAEITKRGGDAFACDNMDDLRKRIRHPQHELPID